MTLTMTPSHNRDDACLRGRMANIVSFKRGRAFRWDSLSALAPRFFSRLKVSNYSDSTAGRVVEKRTQKIAEADCFTQIVCSVAALPVDPYILQGEKAFIPD